MLNKAVIIFGPSGVGKTTLGNGISEKLDYSHCNTDAFKFLFSKYRTNQRRLVGDKICYEFALECLKHKKNLIIEALGRYYRFKLIKQLKKENYNITYISLKASLEFCLKNNRKRKIKFKDKEIKEIYKKYNLNIGHIIKVEKLTKSQILNKVLKII